MIQTVGFVHPAHYHGPMFMLLWRKFGSVPRIRRNVSVTHLHACKNNWCLEDPERVAEFPLHSGISILKVIAGSQRVSVVLQDREINSESITMQGRNAAQNGTSRSILSSFAALIPFTLLL